MSADDIRKICNELENKESENEKNESENEAAEWNKLMNEQSTKKGGRKPRVVFPYGNPFQAHITDVKVLTEWAYSDNVVERRKAAWCENTPFELRCKLYDDPDGYVHSGCLYYCPCKFSVLMRAMRDVLRRYRDMGMDERKLSKFFDEEVFEKYIHTMEGVNEMAEELFENGEEMLRQYLNWVERIDMIVMKGIVEGEFR